MASDLAHPAFSKLFVQTELLCDCDKDAILCHRRPRSPDERGPWLFHMAVVRGQAESTVSFETDRAAFLGGGHISANATALRQSGPLSNSADAVLFPVAELRAEGHVITRNRRGQSGLWGWGISGDLPIVLLTVTSDESTSLITSLIQAHHYWRLKGLMADMVILNTRQGGYQQELHHHIINLITACAEGNQIDKPGGFLCATANNSRLKTACC